MAGVNKDYPDNIKELIREEQKRNPPFYGMQPDPRIPWKKKDLEKCWHECYKHMYEEILKNKNMNDIINNSEVIIKWE
jgi:hypothetical protein